MKPWILRGVFYILRPYAIFPQRPSTSRELCFSRLLKNKTVLGKQIEDFFPNSFFNEVSSQMSAPAYIFKYTYSNPFPGGCI